MPFVSPKRGGAAGAPCNSGIKEPPRGSCLLRVRCGNHLDLCYHRKLCVACGELCGAEAAVRPELEIVVLGGVWVEISVAALLSALISATLSAPRIPGLFFEVSPRSQRPRARMTHTMNFNDTWLIGIEYLICRAEYLHALHRNRRRGLTSDLLSITHCNGPTCNKRMIPVPWGLTWAPRMH